MKTTHMLLLICVGALLLRLALLPFVTHPGIADPNYYYSLGQQLVAGQGFTIDYIWQYYDPPAAVTHPADFWMPLTGLLAALPMLFFGVQVQTTLIPFVIIGSLLPLIAFAMSRQLELSDTASLFAAAMVAVLPEFILNSLRTDTTVLNTLLLGLAILAFIRGMRSGRGWLFPVAGLSAGLAFLTRGENLLLLPMFVVSLVIYWLFDRAQLRARWWHLVLMGITAGLVIAPWLLRNYDVGGSFMTPNLSRMFFLVDFREHYAYGRDFNLETLLAAQTPAQLIGKRLFEMAADIKIMYTMLDVFLPVVVFGGVITLLMARDRQRFLTLAPVLVLLGGTFVFYSVLAPIANQGGSFKKAYLSMLPLLVPIGGYFLDRLTLQPALLRLIVVLSVVFTAANGVELMRSDIRFTNNYVDYMRSVVDAANEMGDTNGDGQIVLMAQDPFMLNFVGLSSVAIPMEDRETILEVAQRYQVDYLMMPPARPALDPLYMRQEEDDRFIPLREIHEYQIELYGFNFEAGA